jgi:hypothetical protein
LALLRGIRRDTDRRSAPRDKIVAQNARRRPRVGGQLKILQKGRENVMKNLLFFTAAALLAASTVAYAESPSANIIERDNKWSGGERFPPLPQPQVAASAGCHNVRVRIATHNGHAVYKTRQVCG